MRIALIAILTLLFAGCCTAQRSVASAVNAGVTAAAETEGLPAEAAEDLEIARGISQLGEGAAEACVDGQGWQQWLLFALQAVTGLVSHFTGAADERAGNPPRELLDAVELLRGELEAQAAP
jgi:hypothetical protein